MWSRIRRAKRCCGLAFHQGATGEAAQIAAKIADSGLGHAHGNAMAWPMRDRESTSADLRQYECTIVRRKCLPKTEKGGAKAKWVRFGLAH